MTREDRETLLARYAAGFDEVARALEGLGPAARGDRMMTLPGTRPPHS